MPRSVNVHFSNYRTGTTVSVQRRLLDADVSWIGNDDQLHNWSGTLTFPDILSQLTAAEQREILIDIMLLIGRRIRGVDS